MSKMKRRLVSLTLVAAMFFVMAIPASARASDYITSATIVTNSLGRGDFYARPCFPAPSGWLLGLAICLCV